MSQRDPKIRMQHMLDHAVEAVTLLGGRSMEDLRDDRVLQLALTRLVEIVGEAASQVDAQTRIQFPDVPWREATSMRNMLIHGYDIVRPDILYQTIQEDFPKLIERLHQILQ